MSSFPFGPGSARAIDPEAELKRLTDARKAGELVAVPLADLIALMALANVGVAHYTDDDAAALPAGVSIDDAVAVFERCGT